MPDHDQQPRLRVKRRTFLALAPGDVVELPERLTRDLLLSAAADRIPPAQPAEAQPADPDPGPAPNPPAARKSAKPARKTAKKAARKRASASLPSSSDD